MKWFISQPMNGRTDNEILKERNEIIDTIKAQNVDDEIIDSLFEDVPHDAKPLWYLGESIKKLSEADIAYFANGWMSARGCKIEHECALQYGLTIIEDNN